METTRMVLPCHVVDKIPLSETCPTGFETQPEEVVFDPAVHVDYQQPEYVVDMNFNKVSYTEYVNRKEEFGELAFTSPFKLLSSEGVQTLRNLVDRYKDHSSLKQSNGRIPLCMRGVGYVSPFIRDLNRSELVDNLMGEMAREPLCAHGMRMNYGHVNVGLIGDDRPVDAWHIDSVDYVVVIILSDMQDAVGGALQVALHDDVKARQLLSENKELVEGVDMMTVQYPGAGWAIFMQGSRILHHVTPVSFAREPRISFVNSYMRRNVFGPDRTRYSLFHEQDAKHVAGVDFARMKAWRVSGMMDYVLRKVPHTEDAQSYMVVLDRAIEELKEARALLLGEVNNAPGYYDEKNKTDRVRLYDTLPTAVA